MDKNEAIIKGSTKYIMLSARITPEANNMLEMALAYLQNVDNRYKYSKQKAVDDIVRLGASAICRQFENENITEEITVDKTITESIQIVKPEKELEKPIEDGAFLAKRYGVDIINNNISYDEVNLKREEKLNLDVPNLLRKRATP